jgi:hypothetical protein
VCRSVKLSTGGIHHEYEHCRAVRRGVRAGRGDAVRGVSDQCGDPPGAGGGAHVWRRGCPDLGAVRRASATDRGWAGGAGCAPRRRSCADADQPAGVSLGGCGCHASGRDHLGGLHHLRPRAGRLRAARRRRSSGRHREGLRLDATAGPQGLPAAGSSRVGRWWAGNVESGGRRHRRRSRFRSVRELADGGPTRRCVVGLHLGARPGRPKGSS